MKRSYRELFYRIHAGSAVWKQFFPGTRGTTLATLVCIAAALLAPTISLAQPGNLAATSTANGVCPKPGLPCEDTTLGFPTTGICVSEGLCISVGVTGLKGGFMGASREAISRAFEGWTATSTAVVRLPLPRTSKIGCSGTPFVSTAPSMDPCAVYIPIPFALTTGSIGNPFRTFASPTVDSVLGSAGTSSAQNISSIFFSGNVSHMDSASFSWGVQDTSGGAWRFPFGAVTNTTSAKISLPARTVFSASAPRVLITAVPARIRFGARSSLYWNALGVTSCTESSPDGSFSGDSLNGAASTAALFANTMFTITCKAPNGLNITKSVTVQTSN